MLITSNQMEEITNIKGLNRINCIGLVLCANYNIDLCNIGANIDYLYLWRQSEWRSV